MTATDEPHGQLDTGYPHTLRPELHKALEAKGIDYWVTQGITFWNRDDGCECLAYGYQADGVPKLAIKVVGFTDPEQAIAATLGSDTPPYERLIEALRRDWGIEASWDGLRRFWCVELTEEGVRMRDKRDATLGRGECHDANPDGFDFFCDVCGGHYNNGLPEYCPNCGRKVVDA